MGKWQTFGNRGQYIRIDCEAQELIDAVVIAATDFHKFGNAASAVYLNSLIEACAKLYKAKNETPNHDRR